MDDRDRLAADVDRACRLQGDFVLRSGRHATEYFDKYRFESDPALLRRVAEAMAPLVPAGVDVLAGVELGGIPLATVLGQVTGRPVLFVRKERKAYGTCRQVEGGAVAGRAVLLVEDVVSTGGAVRAAALVLRAEGARVDAVACAVDREEPGSVLPDAGLAVRSLFTRAALDRAAEERTDSS